MLPYLTWPDLLGSWFNQATSFESTELHNFKFPFYFNCSLHNIVEVTFYIAWNLCGYLLVVNMLPRHEFLFLTKKKKKSQMILFQYNILSTERARCTEFLHFLVSKWCSIKWTDEVLVVSLIDKWFADIWQQESCRVSGLAHVLWAQSEATTLSVSWPRVCYHRTASAR